MKQLLTFGSSTAFDSVARPESCWAPLLSASCRQLPLDRQASSVSERFEGQLWPSAFLTSVERLSVVVEKRTIFRELESGFRPAVSYSNLGLHVGHWIFELECLIAHVDFQRPAPFAASLCFLSSVAWG